MVNSFLYPRLVEIHRVKTVAALSGGTDVIGLTGYSGTEQSTSNSNPEGEQVLVTKVPASIQAAASGRKKDGALPQDIVFAPTWHIFIPLASLPQYSVRDRDIVVDDEGYRYEVGQAYFSSLGYKIICIRLEA